MSSMVKFKTNQFILKYYFRCKDDRARFMAKRSIVIWVIAVCVWLSDRFVCGVWQQARLPGGHWLWHILVAYCCYQAIVFLCFTDAVKNVTVARPVFRYWPKDSWTYVGIPYVSLESPLPEVNGNCYKFACNNGHHKRG